MKRKKSKSHWRPVSLLAPAVVREAVVEAARVLVQVVEAAAARVLVAANAEAERQVPERHRVADC